MAEQYDLIVVGGGTAGCVLAARLSEDPSRSVCLLEAGPDYGAWTQERWPAEIVDPRALAFTHDWGVGGEDQRSLGARIVGGCSSHNACMVLRGTPEDYDEWGADWSQPAFGPYLDHAIQAIVTKDRNTSSPGPFHEAFLEATGALGYPALDRDGVLGPSPGVGRIPSNVEAGTRWNTGFSHLDTARGRPNLTIRSETLVDRVLLRGTRATGVGLADGTLIEASTIVVAAGAYQSPAILLRSGIGPEEELDRHGIALAIDLPVGKQLLDHCGTGLAWTASPKLDRAMAGHEHHHGPLFAPHAVLKAASRACAPGSFDLHLLSWIAPLASSSSYEPSLAVYLMKPRSTGQVRLASRDPEALPLVERGFLGDERDLAPILEGIEIARKIADTAPLAGLLEDELRPGDSDPAEYVRTTIRNYFHPAGTCPIGTVVDDRCAVHGTAGLFVADASVMPTIPRANTNLTVVAIAERAADILDSVTASSSARPRRPTPPRQ